MILTIFEKQRIQSQRTIIIYCKQKKKNQLEEGFDILDLGF